MKSVFTPAIALLNRLSYPYKLLLIGVLFALPLWLVTFYLISELDERIAFSTKESSGNEYLRAVQQFASDVREHRDLNWACPTEPNTSEELRRLNDRLNDDVERVNAVDRKLGALLRTTHLWTAIKQKCQAVQACLKHRDPVDPADCHTSLIADLLALMVHVGEQSNLILDPDLDSFYLMDMTVNHLPLLTEQIGQVRSYGSELVTRTTVSELDQFRLRNLASTIEAGRTTLNHHFTVAFRESHAPNLSTTLELSLKRSAVATNRLLELVADETDHDPSSRVTSDIVWQEGTQTLQEYDRLYSLTSAALDQLLFARVASLEKRRFSVVAVTTSCLALVMYLFVAFYLAVMRTVTQLDTASQLLVSGQWDDVEVHVDTHDELGQVALSFAALGTRLQRETTALRESEQRTRLIVDTALDAVITMNAAGEIIGWNTQAETMFGWSRAEVLSRSLAETIVPPSFRSAHIAGLKNFLKTGDGPVLNKRIEISAIRRDGREFPVELAVCPAKIGDQFLFSAFIRDITEQRRAKSDLEAARDAAETANRAKSQFLANMSHEFRTPLNGILGMNELLLRANLTTQQRQYVEACNISGRTLLQLINHVLDLSKIESGKLELDLQECQLEPLAYDVISMFSHAAKQKGLTLRCQYDPDLCLTVECDDTRVRQILVNLIGNALKFTESGGVTLDVHSVGRDQDRLRTRFAVVDTGTGIPEDKIDRLFTPFTQVDSSTTRHFGGTGLGLSICKQLVELMGGAIGIESRLGVGSTFWFELPFSVIADKTTTPRQRNLLEGTRLLTVSRRKDESNHVVDCLKGWGCRGEQVDSLSEAFDTIAHAESAGDPFVVILTDCHLVVGEEFLQLQKLTTTLNRPVIGLGASGDNDQEMQLRRLGLRQLLHDPVRPSALFNALSSVLAVKPQNTALSKSASLLLSQSAAAALRQSVTTAANQPQTTFSGHILVAEDNRINQMFVRELLKHFGCTCDIANNGDEALNALQQKRYDLILMDCQMPEMDGFTASQEIRRRESTGERTGHVSIIALTANALKGDRERCLEAGMDDYLSKPLHADLLEEVLAKYLANNAADPGAAVTLDTTGTPSTQLVPAH